VGAVALLKTLSADRILSLDAAAIAVLIENHVISGDNSCWSSLFSAIACKSSFSINNGVRAAAADHVSTWESQSLALSKRRVGNAARAVLSIQSISCSLIEAGALLACNKRNG
jgi:hypothetical protein